MVKKCGGELLTTLCSRNSASYQNASDNVCNGSSYRCQWDRDREGKREVKTVIGGLSRSMVVEGSRDEALAVVMMPVRWEGIWLQAPTLA